MPRRHQPIRKISGNSYQLKSLHLPCVILTIVIIITGIVSVATMVMLIPSSKSNNDQFYAGGIDKMLNNFIQEGEEKKETRKGNLQKIMGQYNSTTSIIDPLINRTHRIEIPDKNRTLAFVHIGKSGGSTISLLLQNGCMTSADNKPCEEERWKKVPGQLVESIASKRILFYLHTPHVDSGKMAEYYSRVTSVVVVARNPLDRFISAFLSRHPKNMDFVRIRNLGIRSKAEREGVSPPIWAKPVFSDGNEEADQMHRSAYKGCYPTIEEFVKCVNPNASDEVVNKTFRDRLLLYRGRKIEKKNVIFNCREICQGIMAGTNQYIRHVSYNYNTFRE